jgi:predicted enzyme related to lactoylglutathione lyase
MINGVHALIYTPQAEEVRAFFRDVIGLRSVDAGQGWLIFALPPAELAIHPSEKGECELYLMCDDLRATMKELEKKGVSFTGPVTEQPWGLLTSIRLPGGTELGIYEPRHPSPLTS